MVELTAVMAPNPNYYRLYTPYSWAPSRSGSPAPWRGVWSGGSPVRSPRSGWA